MADTDKFAALAEALQVGDDTEAIERPEPPRTVRGALQRTSADAGAETAEAGADARVDTAETPKPPPIRSRPAASATTAVSTPSTPVAALPRRRSSANLPVSVWKLVSAAKDARWELSEILARGLQQPAPTADSADRLLRSMRDELRVQRQYRVTAHQRERLDQLAAAWRMTRSEVVAVVLAIELDTMRVDQ